MEIKQEQVSIAEATQAFEKDLDIFLPLLSWAHLNFELQSLLKNQEHSDEIESKLKAIDYTDKLPHLLSSQEFDDLFKKEGFFSSSQTGKRIASFAIKQIGMKKELFDQVEKAIKHAYKNIKSQNEQNRPWNSDEQMFLQNRLLDESYKYSLQIIYVFKP